MITTIGQTRRNWCMRSNPQGRIKIREQGRGAARARSAQSPESRRGVNCSLWASRRRCFEISRFYNLRRSGSPMSGASLQPITHLGPTRFLSSDQNRDLEDKTLLPKESPMAQNRAPGEVDSLEGPPVLGRGEESSQSWKRGAGSIECPCASLKEVRLAKTNNAANCHDDQRQTIPERKRPAHFPPRAAAGLDEGPRPPAASPLPVRSPD